MTTPDFYAYTPSHWRELLHVEAWIVNNGEPIELWRCSAVDVDRLVVDGLLAGTPTAGVFRLTDHGWAVAHALRRHRGQCGKETVRLPFKATVAYEAVQP